MRSKGFSLAGVVLALACCALWSAQALNVKLSGVNYDFRQGPDWDEKRCKTQATVFREMRLLQTITNRVRIYSVSDCNVRPVLRIAEQLNMTVWLGVWVGNTTKTFNKELKVLRELIGEKLIKDSVIDGINVGSEALYRNDTNVNDLISNFTAVRTLLEDRNLNVPMSITDTLGELTSHPKVLEVVDIITFNQFPFWGKIPIDSAVKDLQEAVEGFAKSTKKPFIITETGWAAGGYDKRASNASAANAARFMKEFYLLAEKKEWKYYYFAGFDTPYRKKAERDENTVEAAFGIFTVKGKLNAHYDELVIPATKMVDGEVTQLKTPKLNDGNSTTSLATRAMGLVEVSQIIAVAVATAALL